MIRISVLCTERELADEFVRALTERNLPEKFFYWFPLSVKAWLDLCQDGEYRNFIRSFLLIESHAQEITSFLPQEVDVISLGSGQGNKDLALLKVIKKSGRKICYWPIDSSQALLEMACQEAIDSNIEVYAIKADILTQLPNPTQTSGPRLYLLLGNTLGAFSPAEFCNALQQLLRNEDFLLVDGEIQASDTISGYDNPLNRRFAFAPLTSIGIDEADGKLHFETRQDAVRKGVSYLAKYFQAARDLNLRVAGKVIRLLENERLEMNHSCKYTQDAFRQLLTRDAGLEIIREFLSSNQKFIMTLLRKPMAG
ncbi:L-histidine N(alpha)-methyltransferase [bacterium]|nr:L-histidine N(alpha)-methyltransferase [bacterium]MCI0618961.1 L-histidine N(alpha)-methyltransferase [bacterium]